MGARAPVTQGRVAQPKMYDISAFDDIWSLAAKEEIYGKWDPEKPRDYDNFNPFERNDEAQQCDVNGCFPGQGKGYVVPNRPDINWARQQELNAIMEELKKVCDAKAAEVLRIIETHKDSHRIVIGIDSLGKEEVLVAVAQQFKAKLRDGVGDGFGDW